LALSSLGTKSGTEIFAASEPQYLRNSSVLGVDEGISMLKTFARRQAIDVMN